MTDLLAQVHPITRGILWFSAGQISTQKSFYKDVDYLLNGLLTATLNASPDFSSHVLVSENFGQNFYVLAAQNINESELRSFFQLMTTQAEGEIEFLVIDETKEFTKFQKLIPTQLKNKFREIH